MMWWCGTSEVSIFSDVSQLSIFTPFVCRNFRLCDGFFFRKWSDHFHNSGVMSGCAGDHRRLQISFSDLRLCDSLESDSRLIIQEEWNQELQIVFEDFNICCSPTIMFFASIYGSQGAGSSEVSMCIQFEVLSNSVSKVGVRILSCVS